MHRRRKLVVLPVIGAAAVSLAVASAFGATAPPRVDKIKIKSGSSDPLAIGAPVGLSIDLRTVTAFDALTERLVASGPPASG